MDPLWNQMDQDEQWEARKASAALYDCPAIRQEKNEVSEALIGLPEDYKVLFDDHGYTEAAIRVDHPKGLLLVTGMQRKQARIRCVCLYRPVIKVVPEPWPG
mgnify:CR=1 FL=1|jgi:hypothetical protein